MSEQRTRLYEDFIEFVRADSRQERSADHRRMFSLLLWCFVAPGLVAGAIVLLSRLGVIGMRWRAYVEPVILFFPVIYSLYFMSSGFLRDLPRAFLKGNLSTALDTCLKESEWRRRTRGTLLATVSATPEDWAWIKDQFQADLDRLLQRTRYLTILAGAILYLVLEGIDSIGKLPQESVSWVRDPHLGWVELAGKGEDYIQLIGLGLFLVLLYLTGSQTYYALKRYWVCIEGSSAADR